MAPPAREAPEYVQVFPTLRCNRSCGFCFNRGLDAPPDIPLAHFAAILDRLRAAGVDTVDILGGEPTLHPQLDALVRAVAARGMRTTLSTNGDGGLELLERIEDTVGRGTLRVGVSVNEGPVPGPVASYLERRRPVVKSVCERRRDIPGALAEHLARPGTEGYLIFRDALTLADLSETLSYPEFLDRLAVVRRRHRNLEGVVCGGFVPDLKRSPEMAGARCPAGSGKFSVMPDGSAWPCYLLFGRPEFRLGNLVTDSFEEIWRHPALEFFRSFRGNTCRDEACAHHAACHGGCPAVSLRVTGDVAAPDPRCVAP